VSIVPQAFGLVDEGSHINVEIVHEGAVPERNRSSVDTTNHTFPSNRLKLICS
jgi:hypothetical protein